MRARISRRSGAGAQRGSPSCGRLRGTSPPPLLEPADLPYPRRRTRHRIPPQRLKREGTGVLAQIGSGDYAPWSPYEAKARVA
jgi:hypothetical protein